MKQEHTQQRDRLDENERYTHKTGGEREREQQELQPSHPGGLRAASGFRSDSPDPPSNKRVEEEVILENRMRRGGG